MSVHNKNAATEDAVGTLHNAITRLFNMKADALLKEIEADPEVAMHLVQGKDIGAMCKWVLDNGITAIPAAQEGDSALKKKLDKIRAASQGKVIQFAKEA